MPSRQQEYSRSPLQLSQTVKKLVLSSAVVVSFAAYALNERANGADSTALSQPKTTTKPNQVSAIPPFEPTATQTAQPQGSTRNTAQNSQQNVQPKAPQAQPT